MFLDTNHTTPDAQRETHKRLEEEGQGLLQPQRETVQTNLWGQAGVDGPPLPERNGRIQEKMSERSLA